MKPNLGIKDEDRASVALELSKLLADEFILFTKTRNAHWNLEGSNFSYFHTFFEKQFSLLEDNLDEVAERIRALGHFAPATLSMFLKLTHLSEVTRKDNSVRGFVELLLEDHEQIIMQCRSLVKTFTEKYNDIGSGDFVTGLLVKHEKNAWLLRSHLNGKL
ncbi:Dps family protein [Aquiflexum lacus]|uniref:Dps family protein n=1 Tax=Aquiflexum lacus TaxID=2483805 RepID=UPI0018959B47|nr:DNA starvation/stationary phase protection protein [Aquiflexum lacus]